jgi:hypothetical protein
MRSVTKSLNESGQTRYHLEYEPAWGGLDSFVAYLVKRWGGSVVESVDNVYSRRWVVRAAGVCISVYHDSQLGNYFVQEDGTANREFLEEVEQDLSKGFAQ